MDVTVFWREDSVENGAVERHTAPYVAEGVASFKVAITQDNSNKDTFYIGLFQQEEKGWQLLKRVAPYPGKSRNGYLDWLNATVEMVLVDGQPFFQASREDDMHDW